MRVYDNYKDTTRPREPFPKTCCEGRIFYASKANSDLFNKSNTELRIVVNSHPKTEKYLFRNGSYFKAPGKNELERTFLRYVLGQGCSFSGRRETIRDRENKE